MDALKLNEHEHKVYEELFQLCDLGKTTKIPKLVVGELLATCGLQTDVLLKIADMCGASRLGYFGRSQFYIALKLIAVAQSHLPLTFDSFANNLPLPAFDLATLKTKLVNYEPTAYSNVPETQPPPSVVPVLPVGPGGVLPPPPTKKHVRNISGTGQPGSVPTIAGPHPLLTQTVSSTTHSSHQVITQPSPSLPLQSQTSLPPTNSALTPTESNSGWASFPNHSEDSTGPAATTHAPVTPPSASATADPPNFGRNAFGGSKRSFNLDTISLSSADYATSEAESTDDIWSINDEQREYYVKQFVSMQPDLTSTIKGQIAKEFFEKSKLPTKELSKIWKLSDVNRDGALTLQEFCTAMHLVVLRRNDVELPASLPSSLMPYTPASSEPFADDLDEQQTARSPSPTPVPSAAPRQSWPTDGMNPQWSGEQKAKWQEQPAGQTSNWPGQDQTWQQQTGSDNSSQWKTPDSGSPLVAQWTGSSGVQSPSNKPVNFDSAPPNVDSDLAHPIARKVSPTSHNNLIDASDTPGSRTESDPVLGDSVPASQLVSQRSNIERPVPDPRPRPTPKKAVSAPASDMMTFDPDLQLPSGLPAGHPPQVPPRGHWPFLSPDLETAPSDPFSQNSAPTQGAENFANFSAEFGNQSNDPFGLSNSPGQAAAGDKAASIMHPVMVPTVPAPTDTIIQQFSMRDKKEIQSSIKAQKERNQVLVRISSELNQELQEVMEQRISLEIQLEHLKPC